MNLNHRIVNIVFYLFFLSVGYYLSLIKGYGSDGDSHSLSRSYVDFYENGFYTPSRGYGHPAAELIIGFLSYNYGATITTFFSFLAFFLSIIFIYNAFEDNLNNGKLKLFIILCVSNSLLFFDNINSSDFPWALLFFSLGFLLMKKENYIFCCIFFALSVGCRYNFIGFVYVAIFSHWLINKEKINFKKFFFISTGVTFAVCIVFIPINYIYSDNLSLAFSERIAQPGNGYYFKELFPRFVYKSFKLFGVYSSYIILFFLIKEVFLKKIIRHSKIFKYSVLIILINFVVFFIFPAKITYLHPAIIFIYLVLVFNIKKKYIYLIVIFNLLQWIVSYDFIKIKYRNIDICKAVHAISAKVDFQFKKGEYYYMLRDIPIKDCSNYRGYGDGLPLKYKN